MLALATLSVSPCHELIDFHRLYRLNRNFRYLGNNSAFRVKREERRDNKIHGFLPFKEFFLRDGTRAEKHKVRSNRRVIERRRYYGKDSMGTRVCEICFARRLANSIDAFSSAAIYNEIVDSERRLILEFP